MIKNTAFLKQHFPEQTLQAAAITAELSIAELWIIVLEFEGVESLSLAEQEQELRLALAEDTFLCGGEEIEWAVRSFHPNTESELRKALLALIGDLTQWSQDMESVDVLALFSMPLTNG